MRIALLIVFFIIFKSYAQTPTVLISIDGFAQHYLTKYQPKTLLSLAHSGVSSKALLPVFPSKTFPNHLSIVTGKYPGEHGIINNYFYDADVDDVYQFGNSKVAKQWLTAEPIWITLEKKNIKTATYFWPESTNSFNGVLPSYFVPYNQATPFKARLKQLIKWLKLPAAERPLFLATYTNLIDKAGHDYGIGSQNVANAINTIDNHIAWFLSELEQLNQSVNIVIVSDHGMIDTDKSNAILIDELIKPEHQKDIKLVNGVTQLFIYSDNKEALQRVLVDINRYKPKNFEVFTNEEFPKYWHFNQQDSHIPQIVVNAVAPAAFTQKIESLNIGQHGYSPCQSEQLNAIFIAKGPDFKKSQLTEPFENIYIHSLLVRLFNLTNKSTDEKFENILKQILVAQ